jgi:D-alanine-D-alanine ligase
MESSVPVCKPRLVHTTLLCSANRTIAETVYNAIMRIVVGVLRGGPSHEYDVSLKTGASVLSALNREKYEPRDIFIDRNGQWHLHGIPANPERVLRGVDVVFNALHGHYGEDGQVQRVLEQLGVPYTGSAAHPSAIAFNKHRTREAVLALGVKVPHGVLLDGERITDIHQTALQLFRSLPQPSILKPVDGGSSFGMALADSFHALEDGLRHVLEHSKRILVEEFIKGREATVGVIDNFRNERTYALMPVEIIPPQDAKFFDTEAKYSGRSIERVPAQFSDQSKAMLANAARAVHEGLGLAHYSRSDFIVSPRGIYFLEVNTLPGLTSESLLPKALEAGGTTLPQFIDHVLQLAAHKS